MSEIHHDVIVIGAGLAGTTATIALTRAGYDAAIIDTHAVYPPDFRAEKLGVPQMDLFEKLGFGELARAVTTPVDEVCVTRFGHLVSRHAVREYGVHYTPFINDLRGALPASQASIQRRTCRHQRSPCLSPRKRISGRGVTRSLPRATLNSRNSSVTCTQTRCATPSWSWVAQQPSRK
jgi:hypothetical protein